VGKLDAEFEKPIGDPGTVAVGDPSGEDLSTGDQDCGARAHLAAGAGIAHHEWSRRELGC